LKDVSVLLQEEISVLGMIWVNCRDWIRLTPGKN